MAATTCRRILLLLLLNFYPLFLQAENVAYQKSTYQHGTSGGHRAGLAVDGNRNQDGSNGDCAVSDSYDPGLGQGSPTPAWWAVDLGTSDTSELFFIQRVRIFNRRDNSADNIRDSIIKVGTYRDVSMQNDCARIDRADDLVQKHCNPIAPVRYLSIVSTHASSLHLCEVEVEGYSNKVFQNPFSAPVITEVLPGGVILLQITPPQQPVSSYQVLYTPLSGGARELYGNKTTQGQGYLIEQRYLFPGTQYSIRVLSIIQEGTREKAIGISNEVIIRIPSDPEIPRMSFPPQKLSVGSAYIEIRFLAVVGTWYYKVEVMGATSIVQTKQITSDPSKAEYTETVTGLQPTTSYVLNVIPYGQVDGVAVRGIKADYLPFQTLNAGASGMPTTQGPIKSTVGGPFPVGTTVPSRFTTRYMEQPTTYIPPNAVYTTKTTMNCTSGLEGPLCAPAASGEGGWVVPTAAGVAGGVVVLLAIALIIAFCIRRRRKKADDGGDTALNRQSNTYVDDEAIHPQYYSSTLPTSSEANTISELSSKRNSAATVTGSQRNSAATVASSQRNSAATVASSQRNSAATVTGSQTSRGSRASRQEPEPEPTEEEDKLHEDIDTLYAKINKGSSTYNSQNGIRP